MSSKAREALEVAVAKSETAAATCEKSSQVGNAAKMRYALKYLRDAAREFHHLILNSKHNEICDKYKYAEVAKLSDAIVNANFALAAPARNCDLLANAQDALATIHNDRCYVQNLIDDILREMRKDMPRVVDAKVILRNYADRIEAAVKALVADRDNWRLQALAEEARANAATCKAFEIACDTRSEPLRNCDVGTLEEQAQRFNDYCHKQGNSCCVGRSNGACPMFRGYKVDCAIVWSQMPYEEEGEK